MWITLAIAAVGAGIQLFGQVRQNNALENEANANLTQAEANTKLGVLKADAAYLGALSQSNQAAAQTAEEKARIEANQKRLRTAAIIGAVALVLIIAIVLTVKIRKS